MLDKGKKWCTRPIRSIPIYISSSLIKKMSKVIVNVAQSNRSVIGQTLLQKLPVLMPEICVQLSLQHHCICSGTDPSFCRKCIGNNTFYHFFSRKWLVFSLTFDFAPVLASLMILPKLPQCFVNKMTTTFVNSMINEFPFTSFSFYIQIQDSFYMCISSACT